MGPEYYRDKKGEWRWRVTSSNGNVVADSGEGYVNRVDAVAGFQAAHARMSTKAHARMSTKDAMTALIGVWHDANEAGCCDDGGPYCDNSKWWARGYLAADLREEDDSDE